MARKTSGKRKQVPKTTNEKEAICVRMERELYELILRDAEAGERTSPGQVRLILKQHYGLAEDE